MPAVKVRCSNPACRKSYLLKDESLATVKACRKCGSGLAIQESAKEEDAALDAAAVATVGPPPADTAEVSLAAREVSPLAPREETLPLGEREGYIGRFEIRGKLGAGAFGIVYRGFDPLLSRDLAIKVPQAAALDSPAAVARFLREPKAAAQLRHPHIVPVYDAGVEEGKYYIASAFIEGTTLEAVGEEQPLGFREAAKTVLNLAEALDYAHSLGVVHRDIKPANIMLDARGDALLMDFGLARLEAAEELTHDGALLGTPAYMAPEQAAGDQERVGPHSDQYSLGVVLYELLCGRRPFSGPPAVVIYNAIHDSSPPPRGIRPGIPADLETICLKALAKLPAERYASCQELADDLRRWLDDQPIRARQLGFVERAKRWTKRNPALAGLYLAVAVLAMVSTFAAGGLLLSRGQLGRALVNEQAAALRAQEQEVVARQKREFAQAKEDVARREQLKAQEKKKVAEEALASAQAAAEARQKEEDLAAKAKDDADTKALKLAGIEKTKTDDQAKTSAAIQERNSAAPDLAWRTYCVLLSEADAAWSKGNRAATLAALSKCEADLRGWEWRLLESLCRGAKEEIESVPIAEYSGLSRDGSRIRSYQRVEGEQVAKQNVFEMPELRPVPADLWGRDFLEVQYALQYGSAEGPPEVLQALLAHEKRYRQVAKVTRKFLGYAPDGSLLFYVGLESRTNRRYLAGESQQPAVWMFDVGPEREPKHRRVCAGFVTTAIHFSPDGKLWVFLGKQVDGTSGLYYGPGPDDLRFIPASNRMYGTLSLCGIANGQVVVVTSEGYLHLNSNDGTSRVVPCKLPGYFIPSISDDGKRLWDYGRELRDLESGKTLPSLSFLPWNSKAFHGLEPYGKLIVNESWTSLTMIGKDATGKFFWRRWRLVE